jgi:pimeloyl-ACP methyl ester carboxylesterase
MHPQLQMVKDFHDKLQVSSTQQLQELPAGARLEVIAGAGHFPFIDDTSRFVEAVTGFLLPEGAPSRE